MNLENYQSENWKMYTEHIIRFIESIGFIFLNSSKENKTIKYIKTINKTNYTITIFENYVIDMSNKMDNGIKFSHSPFYMNSKSDFDRLLFHLKSEFPADIRKLKINKLLNDSN